MTPLNLGADGLAIRVTSDDPEDGAWLAEFLGPALAPGITPAGPVRDLRLTREDTALAGWDATSGAPAIVYVLDNGPLWLPRQRIGSGALVHDADFDTWYHAEADGVTLIDQPPGEAAHAQLPRRARIALMRATREHAMHHLRRRGHTILHAAAVARGGRAIAIAGVKTAGKTSLLTAALAFAEDTTLLANDRVAVRHEGRAWLATGIASIVSVRAGMLALLPSLRQQLTAAACGITHRASTAAPPQERPDGGISLSPIQYALALGTSLEATATLTTIAFPRLDPSQRGVGIQPLDVDAAARALAGALFSAGALEARSELFDVTEAGPWPGVAEHDRAVRALAETVRCVELRVGPDAYRPDVMEPLVGELLG